MIGQYCAEAILRKHLAEYGVIPELATELVGFEQNGESVTAHLVKHNGDKDVEETVVVDYLVGSDGAHSKRLRILLYLPMPLINFSGVVRKALGLTFLGVTRPSDRLIVADIEIKGLSRDVSMGLFTSVFYHADIALVCSTGIPGETLRPERTFSIVCYT